MLAWWCLHQDVVSNCLVLGGKGLVEVAFASALRLQQQGASVEVMLKLSQLPGPGQRAFLMGSSGERERETG